MNHLGTVELKTNRLILRQIKEKDAENILNSFINNDDYVYYMNKEKRSLEQEINSLKGIEQKYENIEYYNWLITLKDETIIGTISLNVDNYNESLECNYAIDNKHKNNGYMTEALNVVKEFAITKLNVNRFFGVCEINNIASKKVMKKCGFEYEGILRSFLKLRDGYHDVRVYSFINKRDK